MSRSPASLPNATRRELSSVVGLFGRGEHVGERPADVVHVRRAVAADVLEEPRRRELRGRHRRSAGERHRPPGDDRVGVEQRHREVADVGGRHLELPDQVESREQHHQVGHLDGLRVAARARGEDHHERVHGLDLAQRHQLAGCADELGPLLAGRVEQAYAGQVDALEQVPVLGIGDEDLALGPSYVRSEAVAATGRVDAAEHVAAQTRGGHRPQHVRGVAEQHPDVGRPLAVEQADQCGGLGTRLGDVLTPRPRPVAVQHARAGRPPPVRAAAAGPSRPRLCLLLAPSF